jgi:hypothetical protein
MDQQKKSILSKLFKGGGAGNGNTRQQQMNNTGNFNANGSVNASFNEQLMT